MRRPFWILLVGLLAACNSNPGHILLTPDPDYQATAAILSRDATHVAHDLEMALATEEPAPPVPTSTPTASAASAPEYTVIQCMYRPPNGTLVRFLKPMASRECHDTRCAKQGHVVVGSIRPVDAAYPEAEGMWLRFSYLPLEEKPYNLLTWEKKDGEWQWVLARQYIIGDEGSDFECVQEVQP